MLMDAEEMPEVIPIWISGKLSLRSVYDPLTRLCRI